MLPNEMLGAYLSVRTVCVEIENTPLYVRATKLVCKETRMQSVVTVIPVIYWKTKNSFQ